MRNLQIILSILLFSFLISSCGDTNKNNINISGTLKSSNIQSVDYSNVELIVERGAFHYDKFVLKDTLITFIPTSEITGEGNDKYNHVLEQRISKKERDKLINYIIDNGFFELENTYYSQSSCSSSLKITFKFGDKTKIIVSEDFERECPDLLKHIEKQIIILHDKDLKRISLPG